MALPRKDYKVGWICAKPFERDAAVAMLDDSHPLGGKLPGGRYSLGRIGEHNVVIIYHVSPLVAKLDIERDFPSTAFLLMVGIGGGVPSAKEDVRLGDVVISSSGYSSGSMGSGVVQYATGTGSITGRDLNAPPTILLSAMRRLLMGVLEGKTDLIKTISNSPLGDLPEYEHGKAGPDILFASNYKHDDGPDCILCSAVRSVDRAPRRPKKIVIHCGRIASGLQVVPDGEERNRINKELGGNILCFETEFYGLPVQHKCLLIKGISDYTDSHRNVDWQRYAAAAAAAAAKELLLVTPATS